MGAGAASHVVVEQQEAGNVVVSHCSLKCWVILEQTNEEV